MLISDYSLFHTLGVCLLWAIVAAVGHRFVIMLVRQTEGGKKRCSELGEKTFFRVYLIPATYLIDPLIGWFRRLLGLDRGFSESFISTYKNKFNASFAPLVADELGSDVYWLSSFRAAAHNPCMNRISTPGSICTGFHEMPVRHLL